MRMCFYFKPLFKRCKPVQGRFRSVVITTEVTPHLYFQIFVGVEAQKIVKAFLINPVTPFYFPIVARCSWTNEFMLNSQRLTGFVQWMRSFGFAKKRKLCAIVGLQDFREVAKIVNGSPEEI